MNELQDEEEKLRKIINIVRPTTLPELLNPQREEYIPKVEQKPRVNTIINSQSVIIPTIPEVEIKSDTEEKVKVSVNEKKAEEVIKETDILKEAEGILI